MKIRKYKYYKHGGHNRSSSTVGTYSSTKQLLPGLEKTISKSVSALKTKKGGK